MMNKEIDHINFNPSDWRLTTRDPSGSSFGFTVNQSLCSKLKSFCSMLDNNQLTVTHNQCC